MADTDSTSKKCTKCGEVKPVFEFNKCKANKTGLQVNCKACQAARFSAWRKANSAISAERLVVYRAENKEKIKARQAAYQIENREKINERKAAYRVANPARIKEIASAYRAANPAKEKARGVAYRAKNPEKRKAAVAAWRAANPEACRIGSQNRRAKKREAGGGLSSGLSIKLFKLQKGKCPCCKQPLGNDYHLDHKMPLALGGKHTDSNMQLLRAKCNLQKHAKHPIDFMQERGFLL